MHWRIASFTLPLLAFLVTAQVYHCRWTTENLDALRTLLQPGSIPPSARPHWVAGLVGLLFFTSIVLFFPIGIQELLSREHWVFEHVWEWFTVPALGWYTGQLTYLLIKDAQGVSHLAERVSDFDLLDLDPLAPFLRQGQQSAMLVAIYIGLAFAHITVPNSTFTFISIAVAALLVAASSLLLPLRGIRRRIAISKRTKLGEVRGQVREAESTISSRAASRAETDSAALLLPALLALEARIESVPEWLISGSSLTRSLLYISIGLGSWLGGAMVERLLDLALA